MRSAGKLSIPRFAPMPPGVDVAATASTPPKSFRSRPIWPTASIVGEPCWPLKYMISEAHDTRLPGACPKISWVIRCVRLRANAYGGFRPRIGDCSFHVNDRSNRRAPLTARTNSSGDGRVWATARPAMATVPATPAAAVSHSRRDAAPIGSSLASGFVNTTPGGRPTDTRSGYRAQPPVPPARRPLASGVEPRLSSPQGAERHGADSKPSDGFRTRRRAHGLDGPTHDLPVPQPALAHRQIVQTGHADGVISLGH